MPHTATLFNRTVNAHRDDAPTNAEPPLHSIVAVGGGTAGWVTAMMLANSATTPGSKSR